MFNKEFVFARDLMYICPREYLSVKELVPTKRPGRYLALVPKKRQNRDLMKMDVLIGIVKMRFINLRIKKVNSIISRVRKNSKD